MTVLVGYSPQESGTSALELGVVMARSLGEPLVVTTVVASPYLDIQAPVDGDYRALLRQWAERSLAQARSKVSTDVDCTFEVTEATSISAGLTMAAERHDVSMLVLGSSAKGLTGRITLGSVIDALTHGARWPLALAPRGYRAAEDERIDRLTVLFSHARAIDRLLAPASDLAQRLEVSVRFASFLVRPLKREAGLIEPSADDLVVNAWAERMRSELAAVVRKRLGSDQTGERFVVGDGLTWAEAAGNVPWREGDLALIGAASSAPLSRVFLGLRASKIVRSLPVPVLLMPRAADA
ncbi:MAG: universal stress protein [Nocardioides sp.]|uniref:universal stress protein n=1 Tax=Nocardioides sp. TaxID=35761 RepID=UPI00326441A9